MRLLFPLLLILVLFGCKPSSKKATIYSDKINSVFSTVQSEMYLLVDMFDNSPVSEIKIKQIILLKKVTQSIAEVDSIKTLSRDKFLKPSAIKNLTLFKQLLEKDFMVLIKAYESNDEQNADETNKSEMLNLIEEKMIDYGSDFSKSNAAFSAYFETSSNN